MSNRSSDVPGSDSGEELPSSIPDDVWEKFVRDSEADIRASAPKEPSARARMVTERLRQQEARGELPAGWRTGPKRRERGARRRVWAVVGVLLAAVLAVVAVRPSLLPGDPFGTAGDRDGSTSATPLPPETAAPTAPPEAADPHTPTLERPFAGSPAERWADGEAGIRPPAASAIGGIGKGEVEKALRQTKTLLVDANLDPATLRGSRPTEALGVIDPRQTDLLADLNTALRTPDKDHDPLTLFSRFDPAEVRLVGTVVKTRGRMTFGPGKEKNSVDIHADYTFVYPVVRAEQGATEVTRTVVRRVLDIRVYDTAHYQATPGRISIVRYDEDAGNSACDVYDGFLHPQFDSAAPTGAPPTGPTVDPYDRSKELDRDRPESCGTVSRV
ncbi:hypothetical protein [Streptomyces griseosporeus]|uniref:hypothetical protein n=1 Tax=Streptomyces griseosporeus TaxID=1910 RepID=UPI0036F82A53